MISKELSLAINMLRFPLCVMVVLIHARVAVMSVGGEQLDLIHYPIYSNVSYIVSEIVARVAVPLFYIFSGYLFFLKTPNYSLEDYKINVKKKAKSLLLPYVFWNVVVLLYLFLKEKMLGAEPKVIEDYAMVDWLSAFWNTGDGMPINYPLWFIRDLIVMVLISPILYYLQKWGKSLYVVIVGIVWFFFFQDTWPFRSISSLFFFAFGAYFSIHQKDMVRFLDSFKRANYVLSICLFVMAVVAYNMQDEWALSSVCFRLLYNACILSLTFTTLNIALSYARNRNVRVNAFLQESNFFIYAYHSLPIWWLTVIIAALMAPTTDALAMVVYGVAPCLTIAIGLLIFAIIRKILPRFTALIIGNR